MIDYKTRRQKYDLIKAQLDNERQSFIPHWKDLSDYILPRRARFNVSDANRGDRRNQKIVDNTAVLACRTLRSGLMAGITSPARPWFRLTTNDPDMAEFASVKEYLQKVHNIISTSYVKSNLYSTLLNVYGDLGVFATAPMIIEQDARKVFYTESFPVGSYWIAKDSRGRVNTFMREFRMTVRQLIETFGKRVNGKPDWSNFSLHVRNLYEQGNYEAWIDVTHIIIPNDNFNPMKPNIKTNKRFTSCYYESGTGSASSGYLSGQNSDVYLREAGYDYFPVLCPRWETTGEDVYGTSCPAMEALGDIKQLQHGEKRIMEAVDKKVRPPMTLPTNMRNQAASILAGDITYVDSSGPNQGFRPAFEVRFEVQEMEMKQQQVRQRIDQAFYKDMFLMLAESDRRQITAREIEERSSEKLLALGPVLEQLNSDLLDPLTDIAFAITNELGLLPEPPPELEGQDLKVEYISIMAQAQKLVGISAIERFSGFVTQVASIDPSVLDKVKTDQIIDVYGDITSVPSSIIRTDEEVEKIRQQRAQAQQQQVQAEQSAQAIQGAQALSQIDVNDENSALNKMLQNATAGAII